MLLVDPGMVPGSGDWRIWLIWGVVVVAPRLFEALLKHRRLKTLQQAREEQKNGLLDGFHKDGR